MARRRTRPPLHNAASRKLARALDSIVVSQRDLDFDELCRRYRAAEATGLSDAGDDADLALEMRRGVAEMVLYAALDKDLPAQRCHDFLSALEALGYTDLLRQSTVYIIYARYCLRAGEHAEGVRVLEALRPGIEAELSRTRVTSRMKVAYLRKEMQLCDDLFAKLRGAPRSTGREDRR
jgi:hypothetical protein